MSGLVVQAPVERVKSGDDNAMVDGESDGVKWSWTVWAAGVLTAVEPKRRLLETLRMRMLVESLM